MNNSYFQERVIQVLRQWNSILCAIKQLKKKSDYKFKERKSCLDILNQFLEHGVIQDFNVVRMRFKMNGHWYSALK